MPSRTRAAISRIRSAKGLVCMMLLQSRDQRVENRGEPMSGETLLYSLYLFFHNTIKDHECQSDKNYVIGDEQVEREKDLLPFRIGEKPAACFDGCQQNGDDHREQQNGEEDVAR